MLLRRARKAVGILCLWMSASYLHAQPPMSSPSAPELPRQDNAYLWSDVPSFDDGRELWPQFRFQAEWVYFTRRNRADDPAVVTGPDSFRMRDVDFHDNSGYRLNLAFMNDDFELEASFLELDGLEGSQTGTLSRSVVFDGTDSYNNASLAAQLVADPDLTPNFLSSQTYFSPINAAANNVDSVTAANDETNELEFLRSGALHTVHYTSDLQDFELNFKGRRQPQQMLRFGIGYRNVRFDELGTLQLRGVFDTVDVDDGLEPDPNNGLSDAAILAAGLALNSGSANGFSENVAPTSPDTLLFTTNTRASNLLNGVQATLDATFLESDYFHLGGFGRAGVYHNEAKGSIGETYRDFTGVGSVYTRNFSDSKDRVAFVGNLGVTGRLILSKKLNLFSSYEVMFLSGVALGPDQLKGIGTDIAGTTSLDLQTHGSAIFHGARVGVEILLP
jgi:hypothetical protein